ncbi:glycoside hydrolase family protein [Spirosoma radiotolerans]|uniref:Glycerophosphoryl diester phosphodiesterase n=1 Tax=Spirosoma radiotolerans TaxID=1379870 RepID=A0A0E3VAH1_9BACT|nr:glycerophosphoryl diester phosphodiesterase [Spirosoma radiotolerans]AKD58066.1 glycerophosphoryl diester phosphodiesterase [Spirosoma radiotolerans]
MKLIWKVALLSIGFTAALAQSNQPISLVNERVRVIWKNTPNGWSIGQVAVRKGNQWVSLATPSGENTLLYATEKPPEKPETTFTSITGEEFPGPKYHYQQVQWAESTNPVSLNTAGQAVHFFPKEARRTGNNSLTFRQETDAATISTEWAFDPKFPSDIIVKQTVTPKRDGYFSLASPTLASTAEQNLAWATVPGYFQGNKLQPNFALAYAYGHGIPSLPVVYRERCASTLCPMVSTKNGITLSIIPEPGLSRDPWARDKPTQTDWNIGLSHMNRKAQLSPTLYYPVLGEPKSSLKTGEPMSYTFRYSLTDGGWFKALNHAVYDIYQFKETLALRQSKQSLTDRIEKMHHYLTDPKTSLWNIEEFEGKKLGAQSYLGGVVGSNKDAMKNSDYGAMWMLANATHDPLLTKNVLPYAENFKLAQQETGNSFFKGAPEGQYYLAKSKKFVEEWGEVVEPIGLTYYTMLDIGNMLLFEPTNTELKERLRLGADRLLTWQKPDGRWAVAYDRPTEQEVFKDIQDLRPTFYGLIVAYRILKDPKYLTAARKGADWFLKNAIETGSFLGVCGDARYAPDFATGQSAQALLDLFDLTNDARYRNAAITAAKIYTTSIYTHPIANHNPKTVNGIPREDWEISQTGLSFEHGGIFGSATRLGPIQLCSHAGMFIRMYQLTKEPIFADMARSGAIGRDAFVEPKTSVASYYWDRMNKGSGPYPHHAWWQIGWLTDYLMAEAELRSGGKIVFPRGFVTPKVGPHQTYGFGAGTIYGQPASLLIQEGLVQSGSPVIDYILARSADQKKLYVILLNNRAQATKTTVKLTPATIQKTSKAARWLPTNQAISADNIALDLPGFGQTVLEVDLQ